MATEIINSAMCSSSCPEVGLRTNVIGLLVSVLMLLAGLVVFTVIFGVSDKSSTFSMTMMVLGTACIIVGVYRLFWKTKEMVYLPTGSVTRECSVFFDVACLGYLTDMINHHHLQADTTLRSSHSGSVRLDVMLSRDNQFAAVQLYQFVPYSYTPVTPVHYFTGTAAVAVAVFLEKCKLT